MRNLPRNLYLAEAVRELDRTAIETHGIPGYTLMVQAGSTIFSILRVRWPDAKKIAIICGLGNNAGDGFVVARLAHVAGLSVAVYMLGRQDKLHGDATTAARAMFESGVTPLERLDEVLMGADIIIDAVFGTGLDRPIAGHWREAVEQVNASGSPVIAVDIPSGLHADTGHVLGCAVKAQVTVSFIGLKQGMFTGQGRDYCGVICFDDLAVPHTAYQAVQPSASRLRFENVSALLKPRRRTAHKGAYGTVLVIGGDNGMSGAVRLAGEAAARVGAGLVSLATRQNHATMIAAARPELMSYGVEEAVDLAPRLTRATVVAIGPGLGQSLWAQKLFDAAIACSLPLVVDADGLNLLANNPECHDNWILTPHPGEASRLLQISTQEIEADRFNAARRLQKQYGGVVILKGAGTLICANTDGPLDVCVAGNPGMATGGMGDVLTGVIAGLIAQGLSLADAARVGVSLHAHAGDLAAADGERGLLASDLMAPLRRLANPVNANEQT